MRTCLSSLVALCDRIVVGLTEEERRQLYSDDFDQPTLATASAPNARISIPSNRTGDSNGKVGIAVDGEIQAFTIFLARPLTSPHLRSRIIRKPLIGLRPLIQYPRLLPNRQPDPGWCFIAFVKMSHLVEWHTAGYRPSCHLWSISRLVEIAVVRVERVVGFLVGPIIHAWPISGATARYRWRAQGKRPGLLPGL